MTLPLVSCLMPTANRRAFAPRAIAQFLEQDYANRELVILDDGADSIAELVPQDDRIQYHRLAGRTVLGTKRNLAAEAAHGDILVNWDDDDWFASWRLSYQLEELMRAGADVCGLDRLWFYDAMNERAFRYVFPAGPRKWVAGGTACFTRAFWDKNRFPALAVGEDTRFVWAVPSAKILSLGNPDFYVASIHPANTSRKHVRDPRYQPAPVEEVRRVMSGRADGPRAAAAPSPPHLGTTEGEPATPPAVLAPGALRVRVGIPVRDRPELTRASVEALRASGVAAEVVLLANGVSSKTRSELPRAGVTEVVEWAQPRGVAACFNRLVASAEADVYVLLENGARGAAGWLERLLGALEDPKVGLAGPSTNRCWNEQGAFRDAGRAEADILRTGLAAEGRFGQARIPLAPLHSLADFCYAVKREVVEAIGAADEGYGLGPCWELDYNVRAARAGFEGVWVQGAYVFRAPAEAARNSEEELHFEASKRRYQDRFCGLRLNGEKRDYEPHCRGEECADFAPRELIPLRLAATTPAPRRAALEEPAAATSAARTLKGSAVMHGDLPLVSCIMPTFNRRPFVRLSVERFREQDYPNKELIVIDDGTDAVGDLLDGLPQVRCLRLTGRHTIGYKRNLACAEASGDIIVQWDDDDWYGEARVARQVMPILAGEAELTGIVGTLVLSLPAGEFWQLSTALHQRMFYGDVHGGTIAFKKAIWESGVRYPDSSTAEDAAFLRAALGAGHRLSSVTNDELFAYTRHFRNAWRLDVGRHVDPRGWSRASAPGHIPLHIVNAYRNGARELQRGAARP
jgi:glycosyltransferase involved in cell wall biosynthesis